MKADGASRSRARRPTRSSRRVSSVIAVTLAAAAFSGLAVPAYAALGQPAASIQADRAHLSATLTSASAADYDIHTLTLPNTGVVREFTGQDGLVFAITWRGPGRPDLRQLLGSYFATLQADTANRQGRERRMPVATERPNLAVHSAGRPGAFWGSAYLPQSAPADFSPDQVQ